MGAFSEIDIDQKFGDNNGVSIESFQLEQETHEQLNTAQGAQVRFEDDALQQAESDAAPQEMKKLLQEKAPAEGPAQPSEEADPDQARKAHEEAEAKRKAEWEAKQAAKKAQQEEQLQKIAAMSEDELLAASAKRINEETERLTRRNMKEYVAEHTWTIWTVRCSWSTHARIPRTTSRWNTARNWPFRSRCSPWRRPSACSEDDLKPYPKPGPSSCWPGLFYESKGTC